MKKLLSSAGIAAVKSRKAIALLALAGICSCLGSVVSAQEAGSNRMSEILNFRQYSPTFASAGQPTREQLQLIKDSGYDRVIYIAFSNVGPAIPEEDQLVKALGMDYLHIPVDFNNPTIRDFNAFADAMQRESERKTLLHCQVNARATAFSFLYRVIYEDVPVADAKRDMNSVWTPNQVWKDFIFAVLAEHGKSAECEECDWTVPEPR
ncbi:MAG: protein tyrosine phosphatase family protein [Pseudomonadota bacterium]